MLEQYISRLRALKKYIIQTQNLLPEYKPRKVKSITDFAINKIKESNCTYRANTIIENISLKYNNIKTEIEHDYPAIFNDLSRNVTYDVMIHDIDYLLNIFKNMPKTPNISLRKEGIFLNGQDFDAFLFIGEIISEADTNIRLIDNFINDEVITILSSKKSKEVEVKIITSSRVDINLIKIAKKKFDKQYRNIQIKISENFHDRFVFIDEKYIYHLGCSIRDVGNRTFMFSRIEDPDIRDTLNKKWSKEWNKNKLESV